MIECVRCGGCRLKMNWRNLVASTDVYLSFHEPRSLERSDVTAGLQPSNFSARGAAAENGSGDGPLRLTDHRTRCMSLATFSSAARAPAIMALRRCHVGTILDWRSDNRQIHRRYWRIAERI